MGCIVVIDSTRLCHLSLGVQGSHQYEAVYKPSEYHVSRFMDFYVPAA